MGREDNRQAHHRACSILSNLVPVDLILTDQGLNILDSVGFYWSTFKIPTFTKGKSRQSGVEVEQTRKIANMLIHVERVNENIQKNSTQPIDYVISNEKETTLDIIECFMFIKQYL